MRFTINKYQFCWLVIYLSVFIWSAIDPKDTFTWFLEVLPAIIGLFILLITYQTLKLTPMLYVLILIHCIILMVGGHYTYAEVPLFDKIAELMASERNNYDKVGHFAQGFVPAIIAREVFIRLNVFNQARWRNLCIVSICLAFSAFYELIEWWVAMATGENAEAFLGTQGYQWDTQSDMFWALCGACIALLSLSSWHNKQLRNMQRA